MHPRHGGAQERPDRQQGGGCGLLRGQGSEREERAAVEGWVGRVGGSIGLEGAHHVDGPNKGKKLIL